MKVWCRALRAGARFSNPAAYDRKSERLVRGGPRPDLFRSIVQFLCNLSGAEK